MISGQSFDALSPEWLAHRYDPEQDAIHFAEVDRATRARVPFLTDENLGPLNLQILSRRDLQIPVGTRGNLRYVFHSAYCCSTLLANAYDRPNLSFSLKEPVILNDLVGWRHRGAEPIQLGAVLDDALSLLARPFRPGERCIIKPSNVVNGFARAMLGGRSDTRGLLLYAPLPVYLGSIASKGLWGRRWVRDLLAKLLVEGLVDLGFTRQDYFLQTDLQVAAVGWLAQHSLFAQIATAMPDRVRTLDSEVLLARPLDALAALDALFEVGDDERGREAVVANVFSRNAKSGEAFDFIDRRTNQAASVAAHGDEVEKVLTWSQAVADNARLSMTLPAPLIPQTR
jgi:hypothetical protein